MKRWKLRAGAALAACVLAGTAFAPSASAHDTLVGSAPKARSTVTAPRSTIELTFEEPVQTAEVVVTDPDGDRLSVGKPDVAGDAVTQPIASFRTTGACRVSWRVVSADGHPVSGTFTFTVGKGAVGKGAPSTAAPTTSAPASAGTSPPARGQAGGTQDGSFLERHAVYVLIGLVVVVLAGGILMWERRRRSG